MVMHQPQHRGVQEQQPPMATHGTTSSSAAVAQWAVPAAAWSWHHGQQCDGNGNTMGSSVPRQDTQYDREQCTLARWRDGNMMGSSTPWHNGETAT